MPQLDPSSFAPQLVWLAIAFIAAFFIVFWLRGRYQERRKG